MKTPSINQKEGQKTIKHFEKVCAIPMASLHVLFIQRHFEQSFYKSMKELFMNNITILNDFIQSEIDVW